MRAASVLLLLCCFLSASGLPSAGYAEEVSASREDQLKAAYLFNFMKFVEWPPSATAQTIAVCFVGGEGVRGALAAGVENKNVGGRALMLRNLEPGSATTGCSVLYFGAGANLSLRDVSPPGSVPATLTVSDAKDFIHSGGMIELFSDSNRLRFSVNIGNAQKAGLRFSSGLLQLAAIVEKGVGH